MRAFMTAQQRTARCSEDDRNSGKDSASDSDIDSDSAVAVTVTLAVTVTVTLAGTVAVEGQ